MRFKELSLADGGRRWTPEAGAWRPPSGPPWRLAPVRLRLDPSHLGRREPGLWRYHEALPFTDPAGARRCSMGEGGTPLVDLGDDILGKVEFASPTLSFKDRGAAVLIAAAAELGVQSLACDSSGNAGTAVAAYAARAGMEAVVFVPESTSPAKLVQARAHGARVMTVPGDRAAAGRAAERHVERTGDFYASHVWNPMFIEGTKTYAYELWEQCGFSPPEWVVLPVGNGTLLLGALKGFIELHVAGLVDRLPRFLAVQASGCAPVWQALHGRAPTRAGTVAEGIAVAAPPRLDEMVEALARIDARVVLVDDEETLRAQHDLARRGFYVEVTAAVPFAAAARLRGQLDGRCVVPLCGAGLKGAGR